MTDEHPITGPVSLPANPKAVADHGVHDLASLGTLNKPPTAREYAHAALDTAMDLGPEQNLYAVLAHLDGNELRHLLQSTAYLRSAIRWALADRNLGPTPT